MYNVLLTLLTLLKMLDFRDFNPIVIFHINIGTCMYVIYSRVDISVYYI